MEAYGDKVKALATDWYPRIIEILPGEGFVPPTKVTITFKTDYKGVAAAGGDQVTCSAKWFTEHPEDLGAIVHELTHVVQHYTRGPRPGWLVEGIADYVRFFRYEPVSARPHPKANRAHYTDSYRTTAHFLNWAQEAYDKDLVVKLNTACRHGKYTEELWKEYTGKPLADLEAEWKVALAEPAK